VSRSIRLRPFLEPGGPASPLLDILSFRRCVRYFVDQLAGHTSMISSTQGMSTHNTDSKVADVP
jgi:hypothetical protein